jgi:glyoxylase-like metal-dependent hydrolase (beta-lactamase superfamily II)
MPRVSEVAPDVFFVRGRGTNWCLVRDQGAVVLVDAGWPKDTGRIVASLREIGASPHHLRALVLTHAHRDHMGAAVELGRRHGIRTHCRSAEEDLALGRRHEGATAATLLPHVWRPSVMGVALAAVTGGGMGGAPPLDAVVTFEDGDTLDLPGRPVAVATPGHTSGHTTFLLPSAGVVVTGDALVADDLYTSGRGPRLLHDLYHHDPALARSSLDRIAALDADVLLPGHGEPIHMTAAEAVAAARAADR